MVFVADSSSRNALQNAFRHLGGIEFIKTFRVEDCFSRWTVDIWQFEFDSCNSSFLTKVRRMLDAWAPYEHPLLHEVLETDCPELTMMLSTPDPVKPSLSWAIQRYKEYHSGRWHDFWEALGACLTVPGDFLCFLKAKGVISQAQIESGYARVVRVYLGNPRYATPDFPTEVHCVVQVGRIVIDWTARQYPDLYEARGYGEVPVPLVWLNKTGEDQAFAPRKSLTN